MAKEKTKNVLGAVCVHTPGGFWRWMMAGRTWRYWPNCHTEVSEDGVNFAWAGSWPSLTIAVGYAGGFTDGHSTCRSRMLQEREEKEEAPASGQNTLASPGPQGQ